MNDEAIIKILFNIINGKDIWTHNTQLKLGLFGKNPENSIFFMTWDTHSRRKIVESEIFLPPRDSFFLTSCATIKPEYQEHFEKVKSMFEL